MAELNNSLKYFINLEKRAGYKLIKRYDKPLSYHDVKIINDILYNEKTHYVEQFKEYLIYEDYNEFLKRYYKTSDLNIKLPKILIFYEKYSKIYANYTVIPESKYMYKNIKRKQKMIDQMQNNGNNESEYEEDEDSNEEMSNTVFSSKVMNSIYRKTLTTLNKSDNGNSEQSINDFLNKINDIENKANNACLKNNFIKNGNKYVKSQKEIFLPMKKLHKEFLTHKHTPRSTKINFNNKNEQNLVNKINQKSKLIDIQFTYSKKNLQSEINKNKINYNNSNPKSNGNPPNKNNNINNPNLIFINSYVHKNNNSNSIFNNNNSIGNTNNSNSNHSNTFHGKKNSINTNISKQKLPTALIKQSVINNTNSNNINNYKENMSVTNINNYFTNATNNLKNEQKYKLSLGETLLKCDRIVLSTNSSCSPNIMNDKIFSSSKNKNNIFDSKKQLLKDKIKHKEYLNQPFSSNKIINAKKIKSHLLGDYNSVGSSLTFFSNKFLEGQKLKNINKLNKKKINKKLIDIQNKNTNNMNNKDKTNENYIYSEAQSNINYKKPESHRNYYHSKLLSSNNSNTKNKINSNINSNSNNSKNNTNNNSNKNFKITVGLKHDLKNNSQKVISSPCSPNNSGTNFYFQSNLQSRKESSNNLETNIKNTLEEYKKKVIHNYNIVNNIHDNSTQINIYTGNELYKSLHFHNNSVFNSSNMTPANTFSKSPLGVDAGNKNKKNIQQGISNNSNNSYFKSNIKGKEKQNKYNLNLKKIIHKRILEGDKAIISERQMTRRKLFEKLGKYFFKNKNENNNTNSTNNTNNINHYNSNQNNNTNSNININIKQNNNNKHNGNKHNNILYNNNYTKNTNNNDYNKIMNKIINKSNNNSSKVLKNKTNNNTPMKNKINPYIIKNNRKMQNICLSPQNKEELQKMNKASSRQNINYNNIINNLNDLKNFGIDDGNKLLIHSERNKNSKIVFK